MIYLKQLLSSLLCRLTAHKWRRLRKAEEAPATIMVYPHSEISVETFKAPPRESVRICARCGQTRLARRRGGKA